VQIHKHYARIVLEFLDCHDQKLILDNFVEILKQSAHEESEEPEKPEPEPKDRTITVWKATERSGLIRVSKALIRKNSEQQQLVKILGGCLLVLKRVWRKSCGLCSARTQCLVSSNHFQRTVHRHMCC
jgi:hypothetical protein